MISRNLNEQVHGIVDYLTEGVIETLVELTH